MADPEQLYDDIVAGSVSAIRDDADELTGTSRTVDDASRGIVDGMTGVEWPGGLAAAAFLTAGRGHFSTTQVASWRLYRCGSVLDDLASSYKTVRDQADDVIRVWRQHPALQESALLRPSFVLALAGLKAGWSSALSDTASALTSGDESMPEQEDWLRQGAGRSFDGFVRTGGNLGARIPGSVLNSGDHLVHQGLAYDEDGDNWLMTGYEHEDPSDDESNKLSSLTLVDRGTGAERMTVNLTSPGGTYEPNHSGGVAVRGDEVYVVSSEGEESYLYRYSMAEIREGGDGGTVPAVTRTKIPGDASSYISTSGEDVYLGNYVEPAEDATEHDPDGPTGSLYRVSPELMTAWENGDSESMPPGWATPAGANGVVVTPEGFLYSTNYGRHNPSQLVFTAPGGTTGPVTDQGNLIEEVEEVDGTVTSLTESGAYKFDPTDPTTDDAGDLWAQTHLGEIPGHNTDGSIELEPQTLRSASSTFADVGDTLESARARAARTYVASYVFGDVEGAATIASAINDQVGTATTELASAKDRAGEMVHGLRHSADGFEIADLDAFRSLGGGSVPTG